MSKEEFTKELNSILNEITSKVNEDAAVSNCQVHARLRRARQDMIEAIKYLK